MGEYDELVTVLRPVFFAPAGDEEAFRAAVAQASRDALARGMLPAAGGGRRALPPPPVIVDHLLMRLRRLVGPGGRPDEKAAIDATLDRVDAAIHYPQHQPNRGAARRR